MSQAFDEDHNGKSNTAPDERQACNHEGRHATNEHLRKRRRCAETRGREKRRKCGLAANMHKKKTLRLSGQQLFKTVKLQWLQDVAVEVAKTDALLQTDVSRHCEDLRVSRRAFASHLSANVSTICVS
ncbi:hypothetical protein bAD24_I16870 [Burkholderia sp. AD24]|nr:hypothetical protein bAD24_I16870 [Burkholderia sp. AD24]